LYIFILVFQTGQIKIWRWWCTKNKEFPGFNLLLIINKITQESSETHFILSTSDTPHSVFLSNQHMMQQKLYNKSHFLNFNPHIIVFWELQEDRQGKTTFLLTFYTTPHTNRYIHLKIENKFSNIDKLYTSDKFNLSPPDK
jgi:hypothetical protein